MAPPKYMSLVVYRKAQGGLPMINQTVKLSDLNLNALTIRDLMRDFIQKLKPNFEYLDSDPQRGRRIAAKYLCCHCYSDCDLANKKDVQKKDTLGGKGFLPICTHCLDDGAKSVFKGGRPNQLEKATEERQKKRATKETRKQAKQS